MSAKRTAGPRRKDPNIPAGEQRVDIDMFFFNGAIGGANGQGPGPRPRILVGRTDSRLGLGFRIFAPVTNKVVTEFVLDRAQVEEFAHYFLNQAPRLKGPCGSMYRWNANMRRAAKELLAKRLRGATA